MTLVKQRYTVLTKFKTISLTFCLLPKCCIIWPMIENDTLILASSLLCMCYVYCCLDQGLITTGRRANLACEDILSIINDSLLTKEEKYIYSLWNICIYIQYETFVGLLECNISLNSQILWDAWPSNCCVMAYVALWDKKVWRPLALTVFHVW